MMADLTILLSSVLLLMSAEAVLVAVFRIFRLSTAEGQAAPVNRQRTWVLSAFAIYLLGAVIREIGVLVYAFSLWSGDALIVACVARVLQVTGASLFVGAVTHRQCGHRIWVGTLIGAFALGFVHLAVTTP